MSVVTSNDSTSVVLCIRMRKPYREYLRALAARERCTVAAVVDRAVAEYSRKVRTTPPPKR